MMNVLRAPTREYRSMVMDARRWDDFQPRAGDVVVATYPKCGTTWTQRIVQLLIFQSAEPRPIMDIAPWLDSTLFRSNSENLAILESQTHRRSIKSHLPLEALPILDGVKYIHVARDGRDACVSMHNHMRGTRPEAIGVAMAEAMKDPRLLERLAADPRRETPEDLHDWWLGWIERAEVDATWTYGEDLPFFEFETGYWRDRRAPWLLMVHYSDLKDDLAGEMRRISAFLDIETPEPLMEELARAASFAAMKAEGDALLPTIGDHFDRGPERFLFKGSNGRWRDVLTDEDLARYDAVVKRKFTPSLAAWIEGGRLAAGDPRAAAD
ncbi:MAG TPA: sulfotransferase domain-containing protein [Caulobacteraceae bacterium]